MSLKFITGNKDKFAEAQSIVPELEQVDFDLAEIQSLDAREVVEHKLREAQAHHKGEFIVEDTSLYVEGLNGLPGPFIKWFLKTVGVDGVYTFAKQYENITAHAVVTVGYISADGGVEFFEGKIKGKIVAPKGDQGFGWDPIFQPDGFDKTFAELGPEEKNKMSMRKIAFEKLKEHLHV
jgi:non-canonical purine NTP pyrophosphatase (RdgB/HAM1 family)